MKNPILEIPDIYSNFQNLLFLFHCIDSRSNIQTWLMKKGKTKISFTWLSLNNRIIIIFQWFKQIKEIENTSLSRSKLFKNKSVKCFIPFLEDVNPNFQIFNFWLVLRGSWLRFTSPFSLSSLPLCVSSLFKSGGCKFRIVTVEEMKLGLIIWGQLQKGGIFSDKFGEGILRRGKWKRERERYNLKKLGIWGNLGWFFYLYIYIKMTFFKLRVICLPYKIWRVFV